METSINLNGVMPPGFFRCRHFDAMLLEIRCLKRRKMAKAGYWSGKCADLWASFEVCKNCKQGLEIEARNRRLKNRQRNKRTKKH